MRIKQSFCYPCFQAADMSLDRLCGEAARIGYAAVELWWRGDEFDELVAAARRTASPSPACAATARLPTG